MATLFDTFQQAAQLSGVVLSDVDRRNKEMASVKLQSQQLDLQRFMADEQLKFSQRTDWENFEKEWNDDITRKFNEYNAAGSAHHYANNYTAQAGNQMFAQFKAQGDIAMQKLILQGQRNEKSAELDNAFALLGEQGASQERLDAQIEILDQRYQMNLDSYEQYAAKKARAYAETQYDVTQQWLYDEVKADPSLLKKTGAELEKWLSEKLDAPHLNATLRGADGTEHDLAQNRREVNAKAIEAMRLKIEDDRRQKSDELERDYLKIEQSVMWPTTGPSAIVMSIKAQIAGIKQLDGTKISDDNKTREIARLEALLRPLTEVKAGSTGARAKASTAAFSSALKDESANIIDLIINGKENDNGVIGFGSFYDGRNYYMQAVRDIAAKYGATGSQVEEMWPRLLNDFAIAFQKRVGEVSPELKKNIDTLLTIPKSWKNEEPYKSAPELAEDDAINLAAFVWDAIAGTDFNHVDTQFVSRMIDEYKDKRTSDALDWMQSDPNKAAAKYATDKGFARGIAAANEDYVFTDIFGKTRYVGGRDTQEKLTALQEKERAEIARVTGNAAVVPIGYEITDGGNDRNSTMTYYVGEGANRRLFKYATNEKGKLPVLMEQLGGEWVRTDAPASEKQVLKERDKRMKAERAALLESSTMPDFSDVRGQLPMWLQNYTEEEWKSPSNLNHNTYLVDAIINARYKSGKNGEYATKKEQTAHNARISAEDSRTTTQEAKKEWRQQDFDAAAESGRRNTDVVKQLTAQNDKEAVAFITSETVPAGAGVSQKEWDKTSDEERAQLLTKKREAEKAAQKKAEQERKKTEQAKKKTARAEKKSRK